MAKMTIKAGDELALKLSQLGDKADDIAKKAVHEAAGVVADEIRANLEALPEDTFRRLTSGEQFTGVPEHQKQDLIESLGITPVKLDYDGVWNVKIGFDGYGSFPTKKYPKGLPNQLLARAIESGSSIRRKVPFVRPAVNAIKKTAQAKMEELIDEETKKIMGG